MAEVDYVEECFQKLRSHVSDLRQSLKSKDEQIELLQQRCEKLTKIVMMQQQELREARAFQATDAENADTFSPERRRRRLEFSHNDFAADDSLRSNSKASSRLNIALNSEDLLDNSDTSPNVKDRIAETENVRSPRIFGAGIVCDKSDRKSGLKEHNKIHETRITAGSGSMKKKPHEWLNKRSSLSEEKWGAKLLKPPPELRKMSTLSLSKRYGKDKLKSAVMRESKPNVFSKQDTTLTQCKSWLLKTGKSEIEPEEETDELKTQFHKGLVPTMVNDSEDVIVFSPSDSKNKRSDLYELRLHSGSGSSGVGIVKRDLFPVFEKDDDTASVVEIPLASQEIIFLDDTGTESDPQREMLCEAEETVHDLIKNQQNLVKPEPMSQSQENVTKFRDENMPSSESNAEESEEFLVRPILIKEEQKSTEVTPERKSAMKRFQSNCADCRMYLQLFGDKKSDAEIQSHLDKCLYGLRSSTPDGFWNPLMQSFPQGDPRNETLIDTRFTDKNKRYCS